MKALEDYNQKSEFVNNLSRLGYPIWDKCPTIYGESRNQARLLTGGEDTLVFVPLGDELNTQVTAFLACIANDEGITIRLFNGYEYDEYGYNLDGSINDLSAETIASICMYLETYAFPPHATFRVNDPELFNVSEWTVNTALDSTRFIIIDNTPDEESSGEILIASVTLLCWDQDFDTYEGQVHSIAPNEQPIWTYTRRMCISILTWNEIVTAVPNIFLPSSGGRWNSRLRIPTNKLFELSRSRLLSISG